MSRTHNIPFILILVLKLRMSENCGILNYHYVKLNLLQYGYAMLRIMFPSIAEGELEIILKLTFLGKTFYHLRW